jgi:hypothetical protein
MLGTFRSGEEIGARNWVLNLVVVGKKNFNLFNGFANNRRFFGRPALDFFYAGVA